MANSTNYGSTWDDSELDLVVGDYFAMLAEDLAGRPYSKAEHNTVRVEKAGRTRGSAEYKYQNISAVLDKLGMSWIAGYKPAAHHHGAIAKAIGRYLSHHPAVMNFPVPPVQVDSLANIFVPPPARTPLFLSRNEPGVSNGSPTRRATAPVATCCHSRPRAASGSLE
jgi:hypothetical protein